jgi:ABC-type branched-subunit amino acid transport system substrate-binding protein
MNVFQPSRSSRWRWGLLGLVLLSLLIGSDAQAAKKDKEVNPPMIVLQARTLAQGDRLEGLALLEDYLSSPAKAELVPWITLEAGEHRRLMNDLKSAREHFLRLQQSEPEHFLAEAATLGITLVDAGETPSGNQLATLAYLTAEGAPPSMDADRHRLLAIDAAATGERASKVRGHSNKASAYAEESGDHLVLARVSQSLANLPEVGDEAGGDSPAGSPAGLTTLPADLASQALDRAHEALAEGDMEAARKAAETFLVTFPESPKVREAEYVIRRAEARDPVDPTLVGVLLPLSGTYAPPGQRLRTVIEMANRHAGSPMRLLFMDTEGDPERSVELLEELVLERGVVAVMGPLLKENAAAVAEVAQALRVPLVCLSQAEGLTQDRPFVYRGFLTPVQQVQQLVEHANGVLGLERFAVLAPDNAYGHLAADAFQAEVLQRGGAVLQQVFYDPAAGDFRKSAAELAAKDYSARAWEFKKLKEDAEERGMDPDKVVLPPLVEYEAIFIPDAYQRVPLVASALAYEEFAIGEFKPKKDDVPLLLLGLNGWHHDSLAVEGGKYVRGGVFVDAFFPGGEEIHMQSFIASFRQEFERDPGVVDALGYDAARMVATAVAEGAAKRESMRELLSAVKLPDSVSGGVGFDEQGEVLRTLEILVVGDEAIERWQPEEFEGTAQPQP